MSSIKIRSWSSALYWVMLILSIPYMLPLVWVVKFAPAWEQLNSMQTIMAGITTIALVVPPILLLGYCAYHFNKYITISETTFTYHLPGKKDIIFKNRDITAYGYVKLEPRGTKLYFCTAQKSDILKFYHDHKEECHRLFKERLTQKYCQTEDGIWIMAVGFYLFKKPHDSYFLDYGTPKRVRYLESILHQVPTNISIFE